MKKSIILSILAVALPLSMMAQDDVYFTPVKAERTAKKPRLTSADVIRDSVRDVDEYNRRGLRSYYEKIGVDSLGNDIIEFHPDAAKDTLYFGAAAVPSFDEENDYEYTMRLSRWDGYYDPFLYGSRWHSPWWYARYGWWDPWFYESYWYDPWYYYGNWFYTGYWGYGYDPWFYNNWYGWGYPYRYGMYYYPYAWNYGGGYGRGSGAAGTVTHGRPVGSGGIGIRTGSSTTYSAGRFGGRAVNGSSSSRGSSTRSSGSRGASRNSYGNFGGSRSGSYGSSTRSSGSYSSGSSSSRSSGSFGGGGSRSGGSFGGGGSRSGGSFGGRR